MAACVESYDQAAGATYQTFDDNGEKHNAQPTVHNVYGLTSLCWPLPPPHHDQHQCLHAHHAANVCVCIVCVCALSPHNPSPHNVCVCIVSPRCVCIIAPTMCVCALSSHNPQHRSKLKHVPLFAVSPFPTTSQQAAASPRLLKLGVQNLAPVHLVVATKPGTSEFTWCQSASPPQGYSISPHMKYVVADVLIELHAHATWGGRLPP